MALDPDAWDEVRRRRAAGESLCALSTAFGISATTISRHLAAKAATSAKRTTARKAAAEPAARTTKPPKRIAAASKPPPTAKARPRVPAGSAARRQLIARLYRAIDTKLKLMERRMNSEIDAIDAGGPGDAAAPGSGRNSADHERETRAFGALVKTINSVRQMQAELDTLANAHTASAATSAAPTAADARLVADAERYRRDIAERLAKFVPPGT